MLHVCRKPARSLEETRSAVPRITVQIHKLGVWSACHEDCSSTIAIVKLIIASIVCSLPDFIRVVPKLMDAVHRISSSSGGHGFVSQGSQLSSPSDTNQFFGAIALQITYWQASVLGDKLRVRDLYQMLLLAATLLLSEQCFLCFIAVRPSCQVAADT